MQTKKNSILQDSTRNQACLTLENLSKNFGGLAAVSKVNLEISQGEKGNNRS